MQGGDVEALYAHGRGVQRKRALELEQGLVGAVVGIAGAHHVAHEGVARVGGGHVKKTLLLATLRAVEAAEVPTLLREPALQDLRVGEVAGEADLGGDVGRLVVVALEEAALELLLPHVQALVEDELHGADDATLAHHEDAGGADGLLAVHADGVQTRAVGKHHLLAHVKGPDGVKPALDATRALEVEVGRGVGHLLGELAHDARSVALQEALHLVHVTGVLHGVDGAAADARTLANVGVKAGPALLGKHEVGNGGLVRGLLEQALGALPLRAGGHADGHALAQGVYGLSRALGVGVGAKVARAGAVALARVLDGREYVGLRDGNVGVGLVVLEVHVEVGVVLGYEVSLQHQGLVLAAHHHVVKAADDLHHEGDLGAVVLQRHVLAHAGAQVLGLAHVDHLAGGVLPQVAARVRGDLGHLLGQGGRAACGGLCHG